MPTSPSDALTTDVSTSADIEPTKLHREAAMGFLCWPMNVVDLCKEDASLPKAVDELAGFVARWEDMGRRAARAEMAEAADMSGKFSKAVLKGLYDWMREPDYAEEFSLADMAAWINRRPIAIAARLAGVAPAGAPASAQASPETVSS
jgi:hypothetical protein